MSGSVLAIVAPYGRCEATDAALAVAELAGRCGIEARYYGGLEPGSDVHPRWDRRVVRNHWPDRPAADEQVRLWFIGRARDAAITTGMDAINELRLLPFADDFLPDGEPRYNLICCDEKSIRRKLCDERRELKQFTVVLPWCSEPPVDDVPLRSMTDSILCLANDSMLRSAGCSLVRHIQSFLVDRPHATVTLAAGASSMIASIHDAAATCEHVTRGRFQLLPRMTGLQRRQLYAACDAVWLALRPPFSRLLFYETIEHRRPAILLSDFPRLKAMRPGVNCWVLPCAGWADGLRSLVDDRVLGRIDVDELLVSAAERRRRLFEETWQKIFDEMHGG